jgi:hypothetical protein
MIHLLEETMWTPPGEALAAAAESSIVFAAV